MSRHKHPNHRKLLPMPGLMGLLGGLRSQSRDEPQAQIFQKIFHRAELFLWEGKDWRFMVLEMRLFDDKVLKLR